jgi:hypothetical protein
MYGTNFSVKAKPHRSTIPNSSSRPMLFSYNPECDVKHVNFSKVSEPSVSGKGTQKPEITKPDWSGNGICYSAIHICRTADFPP